MYCGSSGRVGNGGNVSPALPIAASLGPLSAMLRSRTALGAVSGEPSTPLVVCPACSRSKAVDELVPSALRSFGQQLFSGSSGLLPGVVECVASGTVLTEVTGTSRKKYPFALAFFLSNGLRRRFAVGDVTAQCIAMSNFGL